MSISNIVPSLSPEELIRLFRKEAKIASDGSVEFSRKGIARLTGKSKPTIQLLLANVGAGKNLSSTLQRYTGSHFNGAAIPETVTWAIISHYARKGIERCQDLQDLIGSVGLRVSVHLAQNWETNQSQSDRVAYRYLLAEPRNWDKQFPDEFYSQLERLTGISLPGSSRPHYWANLTNELVYDHLPREIADGVRNAKAANDGMDKLHQYLSPDGLDILKKHLEVLMHLMSGAGSIEEVRSMAIRSFRGEYQLKLSLN
jgi:P63C domain